MENKEHYVFDVEERYLNMTDNEIAVEAHDDEIALEFLLKKYKNFVRSKVRSYFLIGADKEDIVQEGMIGLYKAIRDYDDLKNASFRAFAELCITRQIITAIKAATRQKHMPLNSYVSLHRPVYDDESDRTLADVLIGVKVANPEDIVIDKEDYNVIEEEISKMLSGFERTVLHLYLKGKSYQVIARVMERTEKSIDNALQRAKGKIDKYLMNKDRRT